MSQLPAEEEGSPGQLCGLVGVTPCSEWLHPKSGSLDSSDLSPARVFSGPHLRKPAAFTQGDARRFPEDQRPSGGQL